MWCIPVLLSGWEGGVRKRGRNTTTAAPARSSWHHPKCHREEDSWGDRTAESQTWTPAQPEGACHAGKDGCKIRKPSLLFPVGVRCRRAPVPGSWAPVSSHGHGDRPKGVRDKPRRGFAWLSPAASSPHQAQPLLPTLRQKGLQGGGRSAARLPHRPLSPSEFPCYSF